MSFYYLQKEMGIVLGDILDKIYDKKIFSKENIAITWINYKVNKQNNKGFGCGINEQKQIYPASIVKLVYGLAVHNWITKKRLKFDDQINNAVHKMLSLSSNDATSFVLDILTGTTSGPSIEGEIWNNWQYQRQMINDWIKDLKWNELKKFNCCQKTWEDGPYGRERDFYGFNNSNRNSMSTLGTAKIFEEIMRNINYEKDNINLKNHLLRELKKETIKNDPNNQVFGFLGEGLPEDVPFWSKAGLMSSVRHDAAYWVNNEYSQTLLVVFGASEEYVNNISFLPRLAKEIYKFNKSYIN